MVSLFQVETYDTGLLDFRSHETPKPLIDDPSGLGDSSPASPVLPPGSASRQVRPPGSAGRSRGSRDGIRSRDVARPMPTATTGTALASMRS